MTGQIDLGGYNKPKQRLLDLNASRFCALKVFDQVFFVPLLPRLNVSKSNFILTLISMSWNPSMEDNMDLIKVSECATSIDL